MVFGFNRKRRPASPATPDITASPVFRALYHPLYYRFTASVALANDDEAVRHFVEHGMKAGLRPHPLFDPAFYAYANPDIADRDLPFVHFCASGARDGRDPHPLFVTAHYLAQLGTRPDYPLLHFLQEGWKAGHDPNPTFSVRRYLDQTPEAADSGLDPLSHYIVTGGSPARPTRNTAPFHDGVMVWRAGGGQGDHLPALASLLRDEDRHLRLATALCARQAAQLETATGAIERLQGINDLLDIRARAAEQTAADATILNRAELTPRAGIGSPRAFSVLFISESPTNPSHAYRVDNYVAALAREGITADWLPAHDLQAILDAIRDASLVVAWRIALRQEMKTVLLACRSVGVPVVFDVDDYVFEPRIATVDFVDGLRSMPVREVAMYRWGVTAYRRFLLEADATTVTTEFLADRVRELGRPVFVLPNGLDEAYMARAATPLPRAGLGDGLVRIGYTPGSRTHQKDFRQCSGAIARALKKHARARLLIVGTLDLAEFAEFDDLASQIEVDPTIGRAHVRARTPDFDIHIAPVEIGNPFTEAKSELKFFEPAVFSVPTIASSTHPFRSAIDNGGTGYVASNAEEWFEALDALIADDEFRHAVGARARVEALGRFNLDRLGRQARHAYAQVIRAARKGHGFDDTCLSIVILVDGPIAAPLADLALMIADLGHSVRVHVGASSTEEGEAIPGLPTTRGSLPGRPSDVMIATSPATVRNAVSLTTRSPVICYVMGDAVRCGPAFPAELLALPGFSRIRLVAIGPVSDVPDGLTVETLPLTVNRAIFQPAETFHRRQFIAVMEDETQSDTDRQCLRSVMAILAARPDSPVIRTFRSDPSIGETNGLRAELFRSAAAGLIVSSRPRPATVLEMTRCGLPALAAAETEMDPEWIADQVTELARDEGGRFRLWDAERSRQDDATIFAAADRFNCLLRDAVSEYDIRIANAEEPRAEA